MGEISGKIMAGIYVLIDGKGEVVKDGSQLRRAHREARVTGRLELRLMKKGENWNLVYNPAVNKPEDEETKPTTLKERKERYLNMLYERAKAGDESAFHVLRERVQDIEKSAKASQNKSKKATVESDSDNSDDARPGPSTQKRYDKRGVSKGHAISGPVFEFFTSDDPNIPPQVVTEAVGTITEESEVQPALLWRGPASSATSSRAKAAAKLKSKEQDVAILPHKANEDDMKLNASFAKSFDKSFVLHMQEYQKATLCSPDNFAQAVKTWSARLQEAHNHKADQSPGLLRLNMTLELYKLFTYFVHKEDDSPLIQKFYSSLIKFEKVNFCHSTLFKLL